MSDRGQGAAPQPLRGLRVLEVATFMAAPLAASLLADWGADVVKIEPPGGDPTRRLGGTPVADGMTPLFAGCNRGKRSVSLDLTDSDDRAVLGRLADRADVVIHNHPPALAEDLGIGEEHLAATGSRAVVCTVSAFGPEGAYAGRPALDPVIQALTGMSSLTGVPDGEPMRAGSPVIDVATGIAASAAILAALLGRERHDEVVPVGVALFDIGMTFNTAFVVERAAAGQAPPRLGNRSHPLLADQFAASDGFVVLAVWDERRWRALCERIGLPELALDERWSSNRRRLDGYADLRPLLAAAIAGRRAADVCDVLQEAGITCGVTADLEAVTRDPHALGSGAIYEETRIAPRPVTMAAGPARLAGRRPVAPLAPPALGAHRGEVLVDWLDG